jgi:hypothetical protein
MSTVNQSRIKTAAWVCLAAGLVWLVVVGVLWQSTTELAPSIHVRWSPQATPEARVKAEAELRLARPEDLGERTWAYDVLDSSSGNIERIVRHPLVEDTQDIDRKSFTMSPKAQLGKTERWFGDRFPLLFARDRVGALSWIAAALVLAGAGGLWFLRLSAKSQRT